MKTKHTPGEWEASFESNGDFTINTIGKCIALNNIDEVPSGNMTEEESYANAKLIAAAPELFDAAQLAIRQLREHYNDDECEAIQVLLKAINSAKP